MTSKEVRLSVIIATHNMAHCILECLQSIEKQGASGLEIIVVDDGSTDETARLLWEYAREHPQCKPVVLRQRQGVSHARNEGIRQARGAYIHFVDADDLVFDGAYAKTLAQAVREKADLLVANYEFRSSGERRRVTFKGATPVQRCLDNNNLALWSRLFRREFLLSNELWLDEDMETAEDAMFVLRVLRKHPVIACSDDLLYVYRYDDRDVQRHRLRDLKPGSLENSLRVLRENFSQPFPQQEAHVWQEAYANYLRFAFHNIWNRIHIAEDRRAGFERIRDTLRAVEQANPDCNMLLPENDIRFRSIFCCDYATFLSVPYDQFLLLRCVVSEAARSGPPVSDASSQFISNCEMGRVGFYTLVKALGAWVRGKWRGLKRKARREERKKP